MGSVAIVKRVIVPILDIVRLYETRSGHRVITPFVHVHPLIVILIEWSKVSGGQRLIRLITNCYNINIGCSYQNINHENSIKVHNTIGSFTDTAFYHPGLEAVVCHVR